MILMVLMQSLLQDGFYQMNLYSSFYGVSLLGLAWHGTAQAFKSFFDSKPLVVLSYLLDFFLVSTLFWWTGLNQSLFLFFYLAIILSAGLDSRIQFHFFPAAIATLCFVVVSLKSSEVYSLSFQFVLVLTVSSFFLVNLLALYLSNQFEGIRAELKAKDLSLGEIKRLNESLVDAVPVGLLTLNSRFEVLTANPSALSLLELDDLAGLSWNNLFSGIDFKVSEEPVEISFTTKSGVQKTALFQARQMQSPVSLEEIFYVFLVDRTEFQKMEFTLRQNQKMAAVGQLAAGIAHEIRNPLAGISGSIELLSQNPLSEDDKKLTKIILKEIDRLNHLITEFLEYSKPESALDFAKVDLQKLIEDVLVPLRLRYPDVKFTIQAEGNAQILGSSDKLKQAFLNIIINGIEAVEKASQKDLSVSIRPQGQDVVVTVSDSGVGMSPDLIPQIFEPFKTTKSKGTGLGLAITHKILELHRAKIFVRSKPGLGSEFEISFPT
jgi:two-component system sensor histidine kinase PilS (NtrC family)